MSRRGVTRASVAGYVRMHTTNHPRLVTGSLKSELPGPPAAAKAHKGTIQNHVKTTLSSKQGDLSIPPSPFPSCISTPPILIPNTESTKPLIPNLIPQLIIPNLLRTPLGISRRRPAVELGILGAVIHPSFLARAGSARAGDALHRLRQARLAARGSAFGLVPAASCLPVDAASQGGGCEEGYCAGSEHCVFVFVGLCVRLILVLWGW